MTHPVILAIDTSCDDTSAAVTIGTTVVSNVIASQTELHKQYGGVFPTVAKQAHAENIQAVISLALRKAQLAQTDLDAVAVTVGPGLAPALEVGIRAAKQLASDLSIPLVAVNHVEGHLLSVLAEAKRRDTGWLELKNAQPTLLNLSNQLPALGMIISGGHSQFVLITAVGKYQILGATLDDAAGECLDKIGRMLGLGYPAGPVIEQFAKYGDKNRFEFPLPMTHTTEFNLSFSGMKTHTRNLLTKLDAEHVFGKQDVYDFCASAQHGVFRAITYKLKKILQTYPVNSVWLGGGVAANMTLRTMLRQAIKQVAEQQRRPLQKLLTPYTKRLCMDNAAMIGVVAGVRYWHLNAHTDQPSWHSLAADLTSTERQPRLSL